jgi:hypothetical protein
MWEEMWEELLASAAPSRSSRFIRSALHQALAARLGPAASEPLTALAHATTESLGAASLMAQRLNDQLIAALSGCAAADNSCYARVCQADSGNASVLAPVAARRVRTRRSGEEQ